MKARQKYSEATAAQRISLSSSKRSFKTLLVASLISVVGTGPALACIAIPEVYRVDHETLVDRTPDIALAQVSSIEVDANTGRGKVTFQVLETLKGEHVSERVLEHKAWLRDIPQDAMNDFDRHRDQNFWPATAEYAVTLNRSGGIDTTCEVSFFFAPGSTYLGFFEGSEPGHFQGFELILGSDDKWLAEVRRLLAN